MDDSKEEVNDVRKVGAISVTLPHIKLPRTV